MTILDRVQSYAKWFHLKDIFQLQKNNLVKRFCLEVLAEIPFMQPWHGCFGYVAKALVKPDQPPGKCIT